MAAKRRPPRPLQPQHRRPRRPPLTEGPPSLSPEASLYLATWIDLSRECPGRAPEHRRVATVAGLDQCDAAAARDECFETGWLRRRPGRPPWLPLWASVTVRAGEILSVLALGTEIRPQLLSSQAVTMHSHHRLACLRLLRDLVGPTRTGSDQEIPSQK